MTEITYRVGDATDPAGKGPHVIAHVCNDRGAWGAGFSGSISSRWSAPEQDYRAWYAIGRRYGALRPFALGKSWFTLVGSDLQVVSMVAQHGTRSMKNPTPIRYDALAQCLAWMAREVLLYTPEYLASVHMPRIGCGLAGGTWDRVEPLIVENLCDRGVPVTVYDPDNAVGSPTANASC